MTQQQAEALPATSPAGGAAVDSFIKMALLTVANVVV